MYSTLPSYVNLKLKGGVWNVGVSCTENSRKFVFMARMRYVPWKKSVAERERFSQQCPKGKKKGQRWQDGGTKL